MKMFCNVYFDRLFITLSHNVKVEIVDNNINRWEGASPN